jgi:hypothetical protein
MLSSKINSSDYRKGDAFSSERHDNDKLGKF